MRLRRRQDSSSALALLLCLCAVLLFLLVGPTAHGQVPRQSEPPSLISLLETCEANLVNLVTRLEERTLQVQTLRDNLLQAETKLTASQESLTALRAQLVTAEQSLAQLQTDLSATLSSRDELLKQSSALEASWQAYRSEMKAQIDAVQRERDRARCWTRTLLCSTLVCGIATLIFAVR